MLEGLAGSTGPEGKRMKDTYTITLTIQIEATPFDAEDYKYDLLRYADSKSDVEVLWIKSDMEQERT